MGTEELKALVEAVKSVSGDAREVLVLYFSMGLAQNLIWFAFWLIAVTRIFRLLHRLISNGHVSKSIARHLGIDEGVDRMDQSNRLIHEWVRKAIEAETRKEGGKE